MTVRLVTDSTSDLTPEQARRLGVTVVPLTVRFGEEELADGVDIDAATFYERLRTSRVNPTTSQPSPERFAAVYRELLASADDRVLSIHIAQPLSGTVQSAALAAQDFGGRVVTVDSGTVSAGIQFLLRAALRDLDAGLDLDEVVAATERRRGRVRMWVMLDTLAYLQRGGRIGRVRALMGGVLSIKPVLSVQDGVPHEAAKVRSPIQGVNRMLEWVAAEGPVEQVATMASDSHPLSAETRDRLSRSYPELELLAGELGPVVGTYAGPLALGVAVLRAE